jgi:peptidyl-prolyl cis-trans isomerase B (cyclophilin B)
MTEAAPAAGPKTNVLAIIAIIAAFVFAPVGIVLGFIALNQIKTSHEAGRGLALAGVILGFVFTLLWLIILVVGPLLSLLFLGAVGSAVPGYGN